MLSEVRSMSAYVCVYLRYMGTCLWVHRDMSETYILSCKWGPLKDAASVFKNVGNGPPSWRMCTNAMMSSQCCGGRYKDASHMDHCYNAMMSSQCYGGQYKDALHMDHWQCRDPDLLAPDAISLLAGCGGTIARYVFIVK